MTREELKTLSEEDFLKHAKTMKQTKVYDAVIFGFLIGVAIYSVYKNGISFFTLLPLIYLPIAGKNNRHRKEVAEELNQRNLTL